jgi:DNA-binding LacI/PurR family transcriptional regulator
MMLYLVYYIFLSGADMFENIGKSLTLDRKKGKRQPVYQQIFGEVSRLIDRGELKSGHSLPSIAALAKMLNVNYRTAKLAYEMLAREKIVTYVPNRGAIVSETKKANIQKSISITYIRPRVNSVWMATSVGIEKFCTENQIEFSMIDASGADISGSHEAYLEALQNPVRQGEGLLIVPYELPQYKDAISKLIEKRVPFVFVDRELPGIEASSVSADHFAGAYNAAMHLLRIHKRPVYYFGASKSPSSSRKWFEGWKAAMNTYGYDSLDSYIHNLHAEEAALFTHKWYAIEDAVEAAVEFLRSIKQTPCSVFVGADHIAKGLYLAAEEIGMKVGQDIFMVGFGNIPLCETLDVPLSSVDQYPEQVGYQSAELLYRHIKGEICRNVQIVCPTKLYIRQSSTGIK